MLNDIHINVPSDGVPNNRRPVQFNDNISIRNENNINLGDVTHLEIQRLILQHQRAVQSQMEMTQIHVDQRVIQI